VQLEGEFFVAGLQPPQGMGDATGAQAQPETIGQHRAGLAHREAFALSRPAAKGSAHGSRCTPAAPTASEICRGWLEVTCSPQRTQVARQVVSRVTARPSSAKTLPEFFAIPNSDKSSSCGTTDVTTIFIRGHFYQRDDLSRLYAKPHGRVLDPLAQGLRLARPPAPVIPFRRLGPFLPVSDRICSVRIFLPMITLKTNVCPDLSDPPVAVEWTGSRTRIQSSPELYHKIVIILAGRALRLAGETASPVAAADAFFVRACTIDEYREEQNLASSLFQVGEREGRSRCSLPTLR
jgi:hypothetical protein